MPNTPTPMRSYAPQIMTKGDDQWVGNNLHGRLPLDDTERS